MCKRLFLTRALRCQSLATKSLNALPGLNLATRFAGICIRAPVAGLMPVRLFLLTTSNVPKPVKTTDLPPFNEDPIVLMNDSRAFLQDALGSLDNLAICSINLALFISSLLFNGVHRFFFFSNVVPRVGLEPTRSYPKDFKSFASTTSATSANGSFNTAYLPRIFRYMEAAPGLEPGIRVLQTLALPLGYAAKAFLTSVISNPFLFALSISCFKRPTSIIFQDL